jgi:hypothetical protein
MIDHSNDSKSSKRLDIIMEFKVYIDIEIATKIPADGTIR